MDDDLMKVWIEEMWFKHTQAQLRSLDLKIHCYHLMLSPHI